MFTDPVLVVLLDVFLPVSVISTLGSVDFALSALANVVIEGGGQ